MPAPTFDTLHREKSFREPERDGLSVPILAELVAPHIESFNALFNDSGLPLPDDHEEKREGGLLALALKDIGKKAVFDGVGADGKTTWGNKLTCRQTVPKGNTLHNN